VTNVCNGQEVCQFLCTICILGIFFLKTRKNSGLTPGQNDDPVTRTWKMTQMTHLPGDPMTQFRVWWRPPSFSAWCKNRGKFNFRCLEFKGGICSHFYLFPHWMPMLLDSALTAATKLRDSRLGEWKLSISKYERYGTILEISIKDDTVAENWAKNYKGNLLYSLQSTHFWKWPVVKYKHIKIKP